MKLQLVAVKGLPAMSLMALVRVAVYLVAAASVAVGLRATLVVAL